MITREVGRPSHVVAGSAWQWLAAHGSGWQRVAAAGSAVCDR